MVAQLGGQDKSIHISDVSTGWEGVSVSKRRGELFIGRRRPCPIVALLFLKYRETKVQSIGFLSCRCWMWCSSG
jgi:hypothetical protein